MLSYKALRNIYHIIIIQKLQCNLTSMLFGVCVLKILSILKRKNSELIPHWKMSVSKKKFKACIVYSRVRPFWIYTTIVSLKKPSPFFEKKTLRYFSNSIYHIIIIPKL